MENKKIKMKRLEPLLLFPSVVGRYSIDHDESKMLKQINKQTFTGTFNSTYSKDCQVLKKDKSLTKKILNCAYDHIEQYFKYDVKLKFTASWWTKTVTNGDSHKHRHSHSFISGVYYPFATEGYSINFHKHDTDLFWTFKPKEYNQINSKVWNYPIQKNDLLFFNYDQIHEIEKYRGVENRYSLAFNLLPYGKIGDRDYYMEIK